MRNNIPWSLVIFFAIIAIQVIAGIMQSAAKKKQKEQARQTAEPGRGPASGRRSAPVAAPGPSARVGLGPAPGGGGRPTFTATPAPPAPRPGLSDLEARRQAQLEELRRRRASRGASKPTPAARPQPAPSAPPQPSAPRRAEPIRTVRADLKGVREAQDRAQRERVRRRQASRQQQKAVPAERTARRARAAEPATRRFGTVAEPSEVADMAGRTQARAERQAERAAGLRGKLGDRQTLRDLFVLKELLEEPVALREGHLA